MNVYEGYECFENTFNNISDRYLYLSKIDNYTYIDNKFGVNPI